MKRLLLILSLLLNAFSQKSAQANIASSISSLGSEISEFSTESVESMNSLVSKLDSQQGFLSDTSEALLSYEITVLKYDLKAIESSIGTVAAELELAEKKCPEKLDCKTCSSSKFCVWCYVDKTCVNGDSLGPLNGECSEFMYNTCSFSGCSEYTECSACISDALCGWCAFGHTCYEATSVLKGDCEFTYFYHAEGNSECPNFTSYPKSISVNTQLVLENKLNDLNKLKDSVSLEIKEIRKSIEDIVSLSREEPKFLVSEKGSDYHGLVERADELALKELESEKEYERELWEKWPKETVVGIDKAVDDEFEKIVHHLRKFQKNAKPREEEKEGTEAKEESSKTEGQNKENTEQNNPSESKEENAEKMNPSNPEVQSKESSEPVVNPSKPEDEANKEGLATDIQSPTPDEVNKETTESNENAPNPEEDQTDQNSSPPAADAQAVSTSP